jgi:hypothetical protein
VTARDGGNIHGGIARLGQNRAPFFNAETPTAFDTAKDFRTGHRSSAVISFIAKLYQARFTPKA